MPKLAYDAETRAVRAVQEFRQAEHECAGLVSNTFAMDSAAAIYDAALTARGIDTTDIRIHGVGALRAAFHMSRTGVHRPVAMDAAAVTERAARFPNGNRLNGSGR